MFFHDLGIPASDFTVSVKVYNVLQDVLAVSVPATMFMKPVLSGNETLRCPAFAFVVEHATTGQRLLFDLGPRKDPLNAAPRTAEFIRSGMVYMPVSRDIIEQLEEDGVDVSSINAAIWSHAHYDHIGDMSKFPATTKLVFGEQMDMATNEGNPKSSLLKSDLATFFHPFDLASLPASSQGPKGDKIFVKLLMSGRELLPLHFNEPHLEIGGFKALDYFGDGSFYVLDVPGHLAGHICGLARVTPTTFVYLGGDVVHHAGMLRPTAKLHRQFPCPDELLAATRTSVAAVHFPSADSAGQFNLAARMVPMLDVVEDGAYEDPSAARKSIAKLADFDANDDVFILFAHDTSLLDALGPLPVSLNDWKAKGWKEQVIWSFLDEGNPSFRFNEKMASTN